MVIYTALLIAVCCRSTTVFFPHQMSAFNKQWQLLLSFYCDDQILSLSDTRIVNQNQILKSCSWCVAIGVVCSCNQLLFSADNNETHQIDTLGRYSHYRMSAIWYKRTNRERPTRWVRTGVYVCQLTTLPTGHYQLTTLPTGHSPDYHLITEIIIAYQLWLAPVRNWELSSPSGPKFIPGYWYWIPLWFLIL